MSTAVLTIRAKPGPLVGGQGVAVGINGQHALLPALMAGLPATRATV